MSLSSGLELRHSAGLSSSNGQLARTRNGHHCIRRDTASRRELGRSMTNTTTSATASASAATVLVTCSMPHECIAARLRPNLANVISETTNSAEHHETLGSFNSATRHMPQVSTGVIGTSGVASIEEVSSSHNHHNHHYHNHHHHHHHHHRHHRHWHHLNSNGSPLTIWHRREKKSRKSSIESLLSHLCGLSFSRAIVARPMTRSMIHRTFLMLVIIVSLSPHSSSSGLDSPVKVQRNKQLQLQQQQQLQPAINASWPLSSDHLSRQQQQQQTSSDGANANHLKIDRVRRTNSALDPAATRSNQNQQRASQHQRDCPSNRLIQSLLPPEYAGSPAASQRPSMARAHCECQSDPLGWHVTCFAGSAGAGGGVGPASSNGLGGGASGGLGRTPGGSTVPPMPNQLHPAFRNSQMARQQQQQAAVASGRRHRRSSDSDADQAGPSSAQPGHELGDEASSSHEGFGEDPSSMAHNSGQQHHQPASTNVGTKPAAFQKQRDARAQAQTQHQQQQQNRQETVNYITSFSSDQDIDQPQEAGQRDARNGSEQGRPQQQNRPNSAREAPASERLVSAASSVYSQHLTFQPVPVLFSVTYLRNNMIEIDCDQSVPNYRAAMFRGFTVNEISTFVFNNCQLPNIPFSVLLHRTRTAPAAPDAAGHLQAPAAGPSSDEIVVPLAAGAPKQNQRQPQALKPNRRQQFGGGSLQRRRKQAEDETTTTTTMTPVGEEEEIGEARSANGRQSHRAPQSHQQQQQAATNGGQTGSQTQTGPDEPKVKSLAINLNAIVDQRTLITLLTGLDLLEELQLNYMQLNLTNFINHLQQASSSIPTTTLAPISSSMASMESSTSAPSADSSPAPKTTSSTLSGPSSSSPNPDELSPAASANLDFGSASSARVVTPTNQVPSPSTSSMSAQQQTSRLSSPMTITPSSTTTSTTTTTTTTTTTSTTTTTTPPPASATTMMNPNTLKPFRKQPSTFGTTNSATGGPTTGPTVTSTTTNHRPSSVSSSTVTGPSIGLGAPRGLVIAQATGMPPPMTTMVVSTTPLTTSTNSQNNHHHHQQLHSSGSVPLTSVHSSVSTSSSSSTEQSSSSPHQTTTANRSSSPGGNTLQPQSNGTTSITTTSSLGPGQRNQPDGSHLISIGMGPQSQSVSYTALGPPSATTNTQSQGSRTTRPQSGMFHLPPATTTTITSSSQPPSSSTLMSSSSSSSSSAPSTTPNNQQQQQLNPNRLHQSPSAWTASSSRASQPAQTTTGQLAAGSRLSMFNGGSSGQSSGPSSSSDLLISATSSAPPSTPPSSSQVLSWSAISVSPATAALTTSPVNSPGLSAPANTPSFTATSGQPTTTTSISTSSSSSTSSAAAAAATTNPVGGSSYGFRTGGSQQQQQASNPTTTNQNMRTITTVQQSRRQPTATTIATSAANTNLPQADQTSSSGQGGFIAAGVRLHQQQAAGGLGNQRRFHPQPQQQHQYQPATGLPPATSTSRFSSSSFSSSSSSSSGANPVSVGSDDQFVSHQDTPPASHDHVPRSPTLIASFQSGRRRNHHNSPANDDDETNRANNRNNNHEEDDDDESLDPNTSTTPNLERISRTATRSKRAASPTGPSFEEFELSFGDLLPSLRTLKLESFIDLSPLVAGANSWSSTNVASPGSSSLSSGQRNQQQQQPGPTRKRTGQSGASLIRFKRQPKPDDASPTKLAREPGEPLMADESNQERNSIMVDENSRHIHSPSSSSDRDDQPDVEPGETLWRSASSRSSSSVDASGDDHDDDDDSDGPHVSVAAAPASMTNTSGGGGGAGSHQSGTNAAAASDQTEAELTWAESQLHQRQRQFSAFILGRLFSRLHKLQVLHLTSNEIPYWPDNVLQDSRNSLIRLYLISNNIRQLGARSFAQLVALRSLDLSSNQLRHLDPDLLRDSIELRQLRACRNLFRRLPLKLMMKQPTSTGSGGGGSGGGNALAKLESVDFSKNKYLAEFQLDHHQTASQQLHPLSLAPIVSLNLSDCSLGDQLLTFGSGSNNSNNQNATLTMNQLLFAALGEHLTSVSLKNNKFRELLNTPNLFGKNRQLKSVDLSHNQLERLNSHLFNGNASQIQELRLNHNKLTELPDQFLFNLRKLRYLSLAHNKLAQLNSKLFITNQLLESLDLSKNQITTLNTQSSGQIPFGNGANLRRLSLAYNNLTDFEQDVFDIAWSFYTQLQHLDLSHNKFSGQIQMPIFYTITDQMMFNLGSNGIQSVSVDALVQHEQVIDRYATSFEALGTNEDDPDSSSSSSKPARSHSGGGSTANQANSRGPPTVFIRLGNNPLACDCMLEPLVSYTRRVAAASNPALVASLFNQQQQQSHSSTNNQLAGLPAGSKYSFASPNNQQQQSRGQQQQPQVLYQFRFNNLHCDQPKSLQRRLLNHISIGDLLCPIQDERLCPHQCECHYQSAFKTVIVDCNGRQLAQVPGQLSDASNFNQFEVLTSFNLSSTASNRLTISHVDKIIIRLDNNRLESIDELSHLFQVIALQQPGTEQSSQQHQSGAGNLRFARAVAPSDGLPEGSNGGGSRKKISPVVMAARLQQLQQQRQTREATVSSAPLVAAATEETPLATVGSAGGGNSNNYLDAGGANLNEHYLASGAATSSSSLGADFESVHHRGSGVGGGDSLSPTAPALHPPMSTAVLESAEEFRNKHYSQKSCELYLDHNNIDSLPDSFLAALDQIRASSLQASSTPPQGALPTAMLEPPIHTKLNSLHVAADPSSMSSAAAASAPASAAVDPMKTSASSLYGSISSSEEPPVSSLFGRQPFAAEKKAALMESVQQSVRFNKLQQQHQQQQQDQNMRNNNNNNKFTVSPSLAVLSLRYNNLGNLKAKTLNRLSKLIKSSGTRLYFGHNPFNCSDNFALESYDNTTISSSSLGAGGDQAPSLENGSVEDGLVASPMGDQLLAASDSVSGAYLEPSPDDLTPSASGESSAAIAANSIDTTSSGKPYSAEYVGPLTPTDCPVGQLKTWLTRHHSHIGDLDELYCVHMPQDLANKLKVTGLSTGFTNISSNSNSIGSDGQPESRETDSHDANGRQKARRQVGPSLLTPSTGEGRREHDHPWTSSLNSPTLTGNGGGGVSNGGDQSTIRFVNFSQLSKNGVTWNAESLMASAKLIDLDLYDLCPYSNIQLLDSASLGYLSLGHQRALMSLAVVFIIISLCLLLMLIYFGDTQTILAFVYIHMNPIYKCLHLTESHLDGEKLYDAFVSYSSADRDIVMELIEHLEQPGGQFDGQRLLSDGKGTNLDRSRDVLVTEDDLRPDLIPSPLNTTTNGNQHQALGTLQRRSTSTLSNSASSFQDLSTMSRSTSRMMLDAGDYTTSAHSQQDISSSPALRNEPNNNNNNSNSASNMGLQLNSGSTDKILARQQMHQLSTNRPYRLCIHERDWLPGHLISWNIVNSVQNSRRTILILSKEFIKSVWFQVEFHTAYYQMLEDKIDRLIVIVRGELPPKHELDKNLAFLLTTKTYLTWGEKWFWERLHYALPHRAGPPPPLAVSKSASKPAKQQQQQPRLKKQQAPVGQSHRSEPPQSAKLSGSAAGLLSSLAAGHADPPKQQQQQQSLIMSNIGKDCSRLLMTSSSPTNGNRINSSSSSSAASSGSSGSSNTLAAGQVGGGARSASASSFLSGASSTNQLFRHDTDQHNQIMTTSNDLLSSPISPKPSGGGSGNNNTTRLSVGGGGLLGMRSSSPLQPGAAMGSDGPGLAGVQLSESQSRPTTTMSTTNTGNTTTTTIGGITSIMLDGNQTGPNSRARSKKQEKLQSFVEKEISSRFNLSEL